MSRHYSYVAAVSTALHRDINKPGFGIRGCLKSFWRLKPHPA
jgi:hypothetical protein